MKTIRFIINFFSYIFSKLFFIVNFIETFPSEFPSILNLTTKIMIKFKKRETHFFQFNDKRPVENEHNIFLIRTTTVSLNASIPCTIYQQTFLVNKLRLWVSRKWSTSASFHLTEGETSCSTSLYNTTSWYVMQRTPRRLPPFLSCPFTFT